VLRRYHRARRWPRVLRYRRAEVRPWNQRSGRRVNHEVGLGCFSKASIIVRLHSAMAIADPPREQLNVTSGASRSSGKRSTPVPMRCTHCTPGSSASASVGVETGLVNKTSPATSASSVPSRGIETNSTEGNRPPATRGVGVEVMQHSDHARVKHARRGCVQLRPWPIEHR
jgi:hypothetical protein